jgi:hypothetical protein
LSLSLDQKSVCLWRRRTLEFGFGLQPIIKLITWAAATLKIDFIGAEPDFLRLGVWFAEVSSA